MQTLLEANPQLPSLKQEVRHIRHFVDEKMPCGCTMRKWYSGKTQTFKDRDCTIQHKPNRFICPKCRKEFRSMKALKEHRWAHAIE